MAAVVLSVGEGVASVEVTDGGFLKKHIFLLCWMRKWIPRPRKMVKKVLPTPMPAPWEPVSRLTVLQVSPFIPIVNVSMELRGRWA